MRILRDMNALFAAEANDGALQRPPGTSDRRNPIARSAVASRRRRGEPDAAKGVPLRVRERFGREAMPLGRGRMARDACVSSS